MPTLINIYAVSMGNFEITPFTGSYVRGLFLELFKESKAATSWLLHDKPGTKPYSVKPLKPIGSKMKIKNGMWIVEEGDKLMFGFGILDDDLGDEFLKILLSTPDELHIGEVRLIRDKIELTRKSYSILLSESSPIEYFGIEFQTPTLFGTPHGFPYLFPEPRRVFGNLVRTWNQYAPEDSMIPEEEFLRWVEENIYVRHYKNLKTREVKVGKFKVVGFKGKVAYVIKEKDKTNTKYLETLLKYSAASNIGAKTTYGLGVARTKDLKNRKPITF